MLLAEGVQHGQELGQRGRRQSHAQEPAQRAPGHHGQPGQVGRQSQLLVGARQRAQALALHPRRTSFHARQYEDLLSQGEKYLSRSV